MKSENYKRIAAIDITPKEDIVLITGANEQGKTSVLDALWSTLKSKAIPEKPIKDGEAKAKNELKIGENGIVKYIVTRTFTDKGNYLKVTNAEGFASLAPQKLLDEFVGDLCFDPLAFSRMKSEEQIQLLMKLVKFEFDKEKLASIGITQVVSEPKLLNKIYDEIYILRSAINKQLKQKDAELAAIPEVEKTEKISTSALFSRLQSLQTLQKDNEKAITTHELMQARMKDLKEKIHSIEIVLLDSSKEEELLTPELKARSERHNSITEEINSLQKKLAALQKEKEHLSLDILTKSERSKQLKKTLNSLQTELPGLQKEEEQLHIDLHAQSELVEKIQDPTPQIHDIQEEIQNADSINTRAALYQKREELLQAIKEIDSQFGTLNGKLLTIQAVKEDAITKAKMPIENLKYDGEKITYKNIPLAQVSSAEKLKISLGIIAAINPTLRVVRIQDGSLLDTQNKKILKDFAKKNNLQIWCEVCDDTGKVGFYIEEGKVKTIN